MKIGPVDNSERPLRPEDENQVRTGNGPEEKPQANPQDSVEISESGRRLAEQVETIGPPAGIDETEQAAIHNEQNDRNEIKGVDGDRIRQERVEEARRRLESGHYDRPEVTREIARRIADDFLG